MDLNFLNVIVGKVMAISYTATKVCAPLRGFVLLKKTFKSEDHIQRFCWLEAELLLMAKNVHNLRMKLKYEQNKMKYEK